MDRREIKDIVKDTFEERFPGVQIERLSVKRSLDDDGDEILQIVVVLAGRGSQLNREGLVGFVRHLRTNLMQEDISGFPLLSFVNSSEARKLKLESV